MAAPASAYELKQQIGHGAFGKVYLARSRRDPAQVFVIKKITLTGLKPEDQKNAYREAQLLSSLKHPNVCGCVDSFLEKEGMQDNLCIVMEYCSGGDLHTEIRNKREQGKRFTETQIVDYLIQILMALQYIHERRILHRDLKSKNLFLTKDKRVIKIGDFGIARILEHTMDMAETAVGTPYYLSPEVCQNKPYSYKSDVWSVGCILQELCSLKHPFDATNIYALLYKILQDEVPPLPTDYSRELQDLSRSMLQRNPEQRPRVADILSLPFIFARVAPLIESLSTGADEMAASPTAADAARTSSSGPDPLGESTSRRPLGRMRAARGATVPRQTAHAVLAAQLEGAPPPRAAVPISDDSGGEDDGIPSEEEHDGPPPHRPHLGQPAPPAAPAGMPHFIRNATGGNSGSSAAGRTQPVPRPPPVRSTIGDDPQYRVRDQRDMREVAGLLQETLRIGSSKSLQPPPAASPPAAHGSPSPIPEGNAINVREAWSRKAQHLRSQCHAKLGGDFPRVFKLLSDRRTAQLNKLPVDDDALIRELDKICGQNEEKLHACNLVDQLILCEWRASAG